MNEKIQKILLDREADAVYFVDISDFADRYILGYDKAILFCMGLPKDNLNNEGFSIQEHKAEDLADELSNYIIQKGYRAYSQSQKNNIENGYEEGGYLDQEMKAGVSVLPQKTIARIAGLGFIGKNNLLISKKYGCAFSMCSVLTDAPIIASKRKAPQLHCGTCNACIENCPTGALNNNEWTEDGGRESLINIAKCYACLKCLEACPWTKRYMKR